MPQGIGAAVASVFFSSGTAAYTATAIAVNVAVAAATTYASAQATKRQLQNDDRIGQQDFITKEGAGPAQIIFGETVASGRLIYSNQKQIKQDLIFDLYVVVAHALHECQSINDIYYNDDELRDSIEIDWTTGRVVSGRWFREKNGFYAVEMERNLGAPDQTTSAKLAAAFPADWTAAHRLREVAYTVHQFRKFPSSREVFNTGAPGNIRARIRGDNQIYDPRTDTSPGANAGSAAYSVYTRNNVLCTVHYLLKYVPEFQGKYADFDWQSIADNADICDAAVDTPDGLSARFEVNGALSLGATHKANISRLLNSCLGSLAQPDGKWTVLVGAYRTPTLSFGPDDLGTMVVQHALPRNERFNVVRGTFRNPDANWIDTDFAEVRDAQLIADEDGTELPDEIELPLVTNEYQAQRIAFLRLQQNKNQRQFSVPMNLKGLKAFPGMHISVTKEIHGWVNKPFRVVNWRYNPSGEVPIELVCREDDSSRWVDPLVSEYTTKNAEGVLTPPAPEVIPVTNVTALDATLGIVVKWTLPEDPAGYDLIRVYASSTSAFSGAAVVWEGNASEAFIALASGQQRFLWVVAVLRDVESDRDPDSDTSNVTATSLVSAGTAVDGLTPVFYFVESATQPATPTGTPTGGAFFPPASPSNRVWVTFNERDSSGTYVNAWTAYSPWNGVDGGDGAQGDTGATLVNILRYGLGSFEDLPYTDMAFSVAGSAAIVQNTLNAYVGSKAVQITAGSSGGGGVYLAPSTTLAEFAAEIPPGRRWILSAWMKSAGGPSFQAQLLTSATGTLDDDVLRNPTNVSAQGIASSYGRHFWEFDFSAIDDTFVTPRFFSPAGNSFDSGEIAFLDAVALIDVTDFSYITLANAAQFIPPFIPPAKGEKGEKGDKGDKGDDGDAGPAPTQLLVQDTFTTGNGSLQIPSQGNQIEVTLSGELAGFTASAPGSSGTLDLREDGVSLPGFPATFPITSVFESELQSYSWFVTNGTLNTERVRLPGAGNRQYTLTWTGPTDFLFGLSLSLREFLS